MSPISGFTFLNVSVFKLYFWSQYSLVSRVVDTKTTYPFIPGSVHQYPRSHGSNLIAHTPISCHALVTLYMQPHGSPEPRNGVGDKLRHFHASIYCRHHSSSYKNPASVKNYYFDPKMILITLFATFRCIYLCLTPKWCGLSLDCAYCLMQTTRLSANPHGKACSCCLSRGCEA